MPVVSVASAVMPVTSTAIMAVAVADLQEISISLSRRRVRSADCRA